MRMTGGGRGYGIRLGGLDGDALAVLGAEKGLPAAEAGLQAGDKIIGLNGKMVEALSSEDRLAALRGSPLDLLVVRDGEQLVLKLAHDN